jgi:FixJ family two-component response regulator
MQGTQFLRRAQELCPQSQRVLLTGEARLGNVLEEIKEGIVEFFIQKPWDPVELRNMLERASITYESRLGEERLHR